MGRVSAVMFSHALSERHRTGRLAWIRAAVLGANDGIVSTASLVLGVAAAQATHHDVLIAGSAGLVAGAMSMAAGEYVSVSSQADMEMSDLAREKRELQTNNEAEHEELAGLYVGRGLDPGLAKAVAKQLMEHDALGAHARDELGITEGARARPIQAAVTSAVAFAVGALLPLSMAVALSVDSMFAGVAVVSLASLALLGAVAAGAGGAGKVRGAVRVLFWGSLAMALTAGIGRLIGTAV